MGARSTTPIKRLGSWAARSSATVYQAATDGFVVCGGDGNDPQSEILTDSSNPPTSVRGSNSFNGAVLSTCCAPVKKGHYYKMTMQGTTTFAFWIPLEP